MPNPWRSVHAVGLQREPAFRRAVLSLLTLPFGQTLDDAIDSGRISLVTTELSKVLGTRKDTVIRRISTILFSILSEAGEVTVDFGIKRTIRGLRVARKIRVEFAFDQTSPEAVAWARANAAELVTLITEEQFETLRRIVVEGFTKQLTPKAIAKQIRGVVGLTGPQAGKFARILEEQGKTKAYAYAKKAKATRAETIARTEVLKASNEGQRMAWMQAKDAGVLTGRELREWITTYDDRTCEICAPMDGQLVGLTEPFTTGDGNRVDGPPAHPRCRCATGLSAQTRPQSQTAVVDQELVAVPA